MATTAIWDVRGRLDHVVKYAGNPEKTANPKYAVTPAETQSLLDVMEQLTDEIAAAALSELLAQIEGGSPQRETTISPRLVVRETT